MKNVIALLMVLGLVAPLMADTDVTVSADGADATISAATTGGIRGVGIEVRMEAGMSLTAVDVLDPCYNAYIDYYYANGVTVLPGDGHPIADADIAGPLALPVSDPCFVVCIGVLDESGNQAAADSSDIVKLTFSGEGNVCIYPDAERGGIVGDDLGVVTVAGCVEVGAVSVCLGDVVTNTTQVPPADGVVTFADINYTLGVYAAGGFAPIAVVSGDVLFAMDVVTNTTQVPPSDGVVTFADINFILGQYAAGGFAPIVCPTPW